MTHLKRHITFSRFCYVLYVLTFFAFAMHDIWWGLMLVMGFCIGWLRCHWWWLEHKPPYRKVQQDIECFYAEQRADFYQWFDEQMDAVKRAKEDAP